MSISFPSKCGEVVLGVHMHCQGCVDDVRKWALKFEGVTITEADLEDNTLTAYGKVDPLGIQSFLSKNTKKNVHLISWRAKGEPWVVIRVGCLCSKCVEKATRIVGGTKGIEDWLYNPQKLTVRVKGQANMKALRQTLRYNLKEHDRELEPYKSIRPKVATAEKQPIVVQNIIYVQNLMVNVNKLELEPGKSIRRK